MGALFALGHGAVVVMLAVAAGWVAASFRLPAPVVSVVDWLPTLLLLLLGGWNLHALLTRGDYRPDSVRMKLMPAMLRERTSAWSTVLMGALFATVVDMLAHVSAWSVFATHRGGAAAGFMAGLLFSLGMLVISAADSQLVCRLLRSDGAARAARRARRGIGWFVVVLSFAVAFDAIGERLGWDASFAAQWMDWAAIGSVAALAALWAWSRRRRARWSKEISS
jgi:high-affinity nickel-transport protein